MNVPDIAIELICYSENPNMILVNRFLNSLDNDNFWIIYLRRVYHYFDFNHKFDYKKCLLNDLTDNDYRCFLKNNNALIDSLDDLVKILDKIKILSTKYGIEGNIIKYVTVDNICSMEYNFRTDSNAYKQFYLKHLQAMTNLNALAWDGVMTLDMDKPKSLKYLKIRHMLNDNLDGIEHLIIENFYIVHVDKLPSSLKTLTCNNSNIVKLSNLNFKVIIEKVIF